jgi:chloramphenicol O-acetyltransferase type A
VPPSGNDISNRASHRALFGDYQLPVVNITTECETADFRLAAKAAGIPPFAMLLHALGQASLEIPQFRSRLNGAVLETIDGLTLSYTVLGPNEDINFSTLPFAPDVGDFAARYVQDRAIARATVDLRLAPMEHRAYLFVTGLPWLKFTSIQHPVARFADCSIPMLAVGRFEENDGRLRFPLAVQAHHGLVDGLHIARFVARAAELLSREMAVPSVPEFG